MDEREREALAARVLELAGGTAEAIVSDSDAGLTRFTHNAIHQNIAERDTVVRVRAIVDMRTGVASTNDRSDAGLAAVVERAKTIATFAPQEPQRPELVGSSRAPAPAGAYDGATANAGPEVRARVAADVFGVAERAQLWVAGYVRTERSGITVANTRGTMQSFEGTTCALNVKANGPDATGFAEYYGNVASDLDATRVATVAVEKAQRGAAPQPVEAGPWTVILEPAAFGELLSYLIGHFSAQSYVEGSSFLSEGPGVCRALPDKRPRADRGTAECKPYAQPTSPERRYAAESFTLTDDWAHPLFAGMPFDFEGVPTRRVALLERGASAHLVTDAAYARQLELPDTGHALPAPSARGPHARNPVVAGGERTVEQLIASTRRGLLVSRFWYIRPVDVRRTIVTGMTRDGTFLIEDGAIVRGVRNMRFNESILEALSKAEFSDQPVRTGGYSFEMVVPAAKMEDFHFTSATEF